MAVARVQNHAATSVTTSVTDTLGTAPTAGNLLVAIAQANVTLANLSVAGYLTAIQRTCGGNSHSVGIWYKVAGVGESASVVANGTGASVMQLHVAEYSGLAPTSPLDRTAAADGGATTETSQASGTTAATTQTTELWVAGFGFNASISAPSYTNSFAALLANTRLVTADQIVAATGGATTSASWTTAARCAGVIATFGTTDIVTGQFQGWGVGI